TTSTTTTTLPADLRCCSLAGMACFDAAESSATPICAGLGGTLAAPGMRCDGSSGSCAATGAAGQLCCDCPVASFWMEGPIVPLGDMCFELGCTAMVGSVCDPVTQHCRTP